LKTRTIKMSNKNFYFKKIGVIILFSISGIVVNAQFKGISGDFYSTGPLIVQSNASNQEGLILTTPPPFNALRTAAEWEEVQALTITWADFPSILKQIVIAAIEETKVIIITADPEGTLDYLTSNNSGGTAISDTSNITMIAADYNTIWMRDYGANTVYVNEVDSLILVDWLYNRPRPDDDVIPELVASELNLDLYQTTETPHNLMNTGGNFMSDGFGRAFASELIIDENDGNGDFNIDYPTQNETQINSIMNEFMGINEYIKMPILPYDGIHHIDMHMKLLNEETLLVAEYPDGVADGPQINANIEYVLDNFTSKWGTPFNVIRIPSPPSLTGNYPDNNGSYRTYTNAVFVNNTIIIPTYREEYDTTALRIWANAMPGYNLVAIDCDNMGSNIIALSGAIHCITHTVGVNDPLLISHQPLDDTFETINPYVVSSHINHRSGIENATLFYKTSINGNYIDVVMSNINDDNWSASIPAQPIGSNVYYYIQAQSVSGKTLTRPMPAPQGYWNFKVLGEVGIIEFQAKSINRVFPNPASDITCIELNFLHPTQGAVTLFDISGRKVLEIFSGAFNQGTKKLFFDASGISQGVYQLVVTTSDYLDSLPIIIK